MTALRRWAAAATAATLAAALCAATGCAPKEEPQPEPAPAITEPAADKVAALHRAYNKAPDVAGIVEAASDAYVAVGSIDPQALKAGETVTFIDVDSNAPFNNGIVREVSASGRLIVRFDTEGGGRAPRKGDLCVKLK